MPPECSFSKFLLTMAVIYFRDFGGGILSHNDCIQIVIINTIQICMTV